MIFNVLGQAIMEKNVYMHNWITLLYSRNQDNVVNQLYFNKINFLRKKEKSAVLNEEMNQQTEINRWMDRVQHWMKDLEDKYLCTTHKIKSVVCTALSWIYIHLQFSSVAQSCLTLCNSMNCSTPGLPVHHQLPEFTQTHVHLVGDAIQPSHPLSPPSPPAPSPSQHEGLFQWVSSSHKVAKVLAFQL